LVGYYTRNLIRVKSYCHLKKRELGVDYSLIAKTSMLQKDNCTVFYTCNFIMEILTVGNVECEMAFVLIGYGSRNTKRAKNYGRLKKRESNKDCSVITKTSML